MQPARSPPWATLPSPPLPLGRPRALTPGERRGLIWAEKETEAGTMDSRRDPA